MAGAREKRAVPESTRQSLQQLTPDQVGELLGMSRDSVEALIASGDLAAIDVRTQGTRPRLRVSEKALEAFILARTLPTPESVSERRRRRESA